MYSFIGFILIAFLPLSAQSMRVGERSGKLLMTVPMVGTGSLQDPKRPAFVKESGVPFHFQLSDDGTMAIVEATPRDLGELNRLDAMVRREPRARMFRLEKDRLATVAAALRVLKKDFDPEAFGRSGPPLRALPAGAAKLEPP